MMGSKALLVLANDSFREKAIDWVKKAPKDSRIWFSGPKRSLPQNDHIWLLCTACADQKEWHGIKLAASDWKTLFTAALKRELRIVPNLSGDGFVQLGSGTSDMHVHEASELIEFMISWCAQNGVELPPYPAEDVPGDSCGAYEYSIPAGQPNQTAQGPQEAQGTTDALAWAVSVNVQIDGWRGSPDALKTQWVGEWMADGRWAELKAKHEGTALALRAAVKDKMEALRAA